jgi:DNA sulfur modification protein DndD
MAGENLRIQKVELKNFRPYEDVLIEFSQDKKKSFTIIEGNNSAGKTSLINAMYWCLYGQEQFLNVGEGKPIPNQNILNNVEVGDAAESSVVITISDDKGPKYQISRTLECRRINDDKTKKQDNDAAGQIDTGFSTFISQSFNQRDSKGNWDPTDDPIRFIDKVAKFLPEKLSSFVIFNGEILDSFFKTENAEKIKDGIEKVSGLPITEKSIEHWGTLAKQYSRKAAKSSGSNATLLQEKLDNKEKTLAKITKEVDILDKNMKEYRENTKQLQVESEKYPMKALDLLKEQQHQEEVNEKQYEKFASNQKEFRTSYIVDNFARILLKNATEHTSQLLKESEINGETPPPVKNFYLEDLIRHRECMCGTKFNEKSEEMKNLLELKEKVRNSPLVDISFEGKETLINMAEKLNSETILEKLTEQRAKENEYEAAFRSATEKVNGTIEKLKEFNEGKIRKIAISLEKMREAKEITGQELNLKKSQKQALELEINNLKTQVTTATGTSDVAKKWGMKQALAEMAQSTLNQVREELLTDIREKVQNRTEEIFKKLITRHWQIEKVEIDENYKIRVIDTEGVDNLKTLSAGQTLYLALSYIAAVREVTDTNYPMIIDSPFGRVSGLERVRAAEDLPLYLPDTQITLLVTNTEYNAEIENDLQTGKHIASIKETLQKNKRLGKEMRLELEKISDKSSRTVIVEVESK